MVGELEDETTNVVKFLELPSVILILLIATALKVYVVLGVNGLSVVVAMLHVTETSLVPLPILC